MSACPICRDPSAHVAEPLAGTSVRCDNCGPYRLTGTAEAVLSGPAYGSPDRAKFAFAQRRRGGGVVNDLDLKRWQAEVELPSVPQLIDNLVLHFHKIAGEPGSQVEAVLVRHLRAALGASSTVGAAWAVEEALSQKLIAGRTFVHIGPETTELHMASLTMRGHLRVQELMRAASESKKAFMAMKFGDVAVDRVFLEVFKPAVKQTGFDLVRLDENPSAGLIDDRMRVEIRTSRFLIADLTHANAGAYWEAGFAEGLGRPVVYTCRKDVFDKESTRPHFDTNHHLTVVWDPENLAKAGSQLKAVIRATLPAEALLSD